MKVLVAFEFSGVVRDAFINLGHDAISCDLIPSERPGPHYLGDVRDLFPDNANPHGYDAVIAFPPCDHVSGSGCRWATDHWIKRKNKPWVWHDGSTKRAQRKESVALFRWVLDLPVEKIAAENPVGVLSTLVRKPDQIIQPFMFGHGERKTTCLWLKNLPRLVPTNEVKGREQRVWKMAPGKDRAKERGRTYQGVGDAMAQQWGGGESK